MEEYMNMKEAAAALGVSLPTLRYRLKKRGVAVYENPKDTREKLIKRVDFNELQQMRPIEDSPKPDGQIQEAA